MPNTQPGPPVDLVRRFGALLDRMAARGMLDDIEIWGRVATRNASGKATGRAPVKLGVIPAYVDTSGGSEETGAEGQRLGSTATILYQLLPTHSALLNADLAGKRWVRLTTGDPREWRINNYGETGPYVALLVVTGGLADVTPGVS